MEIKIQFLTLAILLALYTAKAQNTPNRKLQVAPAPQTKLPATPFQAPMAQPIAAPVAPPVVQAPVPL